VHRSIAAVVTGVLWAAGPAPAAAQAPELPVPVRELVEPVRDVVEPVRDVVEPARDLVEPVRDVVEPVRNVVEPVRAALPPVRAPDVPVRPSPQPVQRPAPVTRTVPSPARAPADPSPAPRARVTEAAPAEPAGASGPAAEVAPAPGGGRSTPRSTSAASSTRHPARTAARPPARRERRLRRVVTDLGGCLRTIGRLQRRVLVLRAGVGAARPHSRRAVAGRLDTTVGRVARVERRGLRALRRSARAGRCGEPVTLVAAVVPSSGAQAASGTAAPVADRAPDGRAGAPVSGVREEFRTSAPPDEPGTILSVPGDAGEPPVLLLVAAAFLAGFAVVWARERRRLSRSRHGPPAAPGS
jgi:hypothetical protein